MITCNQEYIDILIEQGVFELDRPFYYYYESDKEINISFSSKFMLDAIKSFNKDKIIICMNNDSSPIVIKNSEDTSLVQLVLPIKTC